MRFLSRRLFVLLLLAGGMATWASVAIAKAPAPADLTAAERELAEFLELPYVEERSDGVIEVDFSENPNAAFAALTEAQDVLEGREVTVAGMGVQDRVTRRSDDLELGRKDAPVQAARCPDLPTGARSTNGSTVAYLGCDATTGRVSTGAPVTGDLEKSLRAAFIQAAAIAFPDAELASVQVSMRDGAATLDLPSSVLSTSMETEGLALDQALIHTAYSNGAVESLEVTVNGDCLAYALLVGGDMCAVVSLTEIVRQD
jgi:hypothetical protein